jgi:hypothetical protein
VTATPTQPPAVVRIVPQVISGSLMLDASKTALRARLDGQDGGGQRVIDELHIERTATIGAKQTSTIVTGSLTTRMLRSLTQETWPDEIAYSAVYRLSGGSYLLYQFASDTYIDCVKLSDPDAQDPFYQHQTPFESLLQMTQRFLYGSLVGEEEVNGVPVRHYVLDEAAFNAAALADDSQEVRNTLGKVKLTGGDVYLARDGNYVVRLGAGYQGTVQGLEPGLSGDLRLDFDLTRPEGENGVGMPEACAIAEAREKLPKAVGKAQRLTVLPFSPLNVAQGRVLKVTVAITEPEHMTGVNGSGNVSIQYVEDVAKQSKSMTVTGVDFQASRELPDLGLPGTGPVTFYVVGDGAYVAIPGKDVQSAVCRSLPPERASAVLNMFAPVTLVGKLADLDVLYGVPARNEKVNGITVSHYRLDATATNDAMKKVSSAANPPSQLVKGDAYIARSGGYLVRLSAEYEGTATLLFDLSTSPRGVGIEMPATCQAAPSP